MQASKTTSINIVSGLSTPSSGEARVLGFDITREPRAVRSLLGSVPQETALYEELVVRVLRRRMQERPEFIKVGMTEYWRFPHLRNAIGATPKAARELVERALEAAAPVLRPGLDRRAASLSLIGFLFVSVIWPERGWIELSEDDWCRAARQTVSGLLRADQK